MTTEYWVWLQLVLGYACDTVHKVVTEYGDARSFYYADDEEKIKRCQLSKKQADRLHKISRRTVYRILKDCNENGIRIITPLSEEYPERLWAIADPPCVLYVKGQKLKLNKVPTIAVVGPRKVSV
ncbi:MAG: DNA-processing protein DprA, partial [Clostridia bacterium]|nr:DNA-processing protein DprA [Clostridia bacterium]